MDLETDAKPGFLQFEVPCPACGEAAQVVAELSRDRARWCCTACLTIGAAPFALPDGLAIPPRPAARA